MPKGLGLNPKPQTRNKSKWVEVPKDATIAELLKVEDHIAGGFPVLHLWKPTAFLKGISWTKTSPTLF